ERPVRLLHRPLQRAARGRLLAQSAELRPPRFHARLPRPRHTAESGGTTRAEVTSTIATPHPALRASSLAPRSGERVRRKRRVRGTGKRRQTRLSVLHSKPRADRALAHVVASRRAVLAAEVDQLQVPLAPFLPRKELFQIGLRLPDILSFRQTPAFRQAVDVRVDRKGRLAE